MFLASTLLLCLAALMKTSSRYFFLIAIVLIGSTLRLWDVNWDSNYHLHPDERFLTMVANDAKIPDSFSDYLDPKVSTLVPYNIKFNYFTYGAFPIAITKTTAALLGLDNYDDLVLVGRRLAALFDTLTILTLFFLASRLFTPDVGVASSVVYALLVLPIQHSHFFVVDSFAVSFFMLSTTLLYCWRLPLFAGFAFGAALGCKISLILQAPVLLVLILMQSKKSLHIFAEILLIAFGAYVGLRCADPKFFASASWIRPFINPQFLANLIELRNLSAYSEHPWPPGVQWLSKTPYLFTLQNFALYGFGIAATWLAIVGVGAKRKSWEVILLASWCLTILIYCGSQFLQTMRYAYPIYPLAAILSGIGFVAIIEEYKRKRWIMTAFLLLILSIWPAAFMNIYRGEHTRVEASRWMLEHLPNDAKICVEHWDDSLPLHLPGRDFNFKFIELPVFESDSTEKLKTLYSRSAECNAIVFSSNRGWGSIMPLKDKFPLTVSWYNEMFSGEGDFALRLRVSRRPGILGLEFSEILADEAFSVYDHPEVLVFLRRQA